MKSTHYLTMMGALIALAGCLGTGQDELQSWMQEERAQVKPKVAPISEPKKFTPETYSEADATESFNIIRLTQALRRDNIRVTNSDLIAPELNRRKEPLESHPLDAMAMVGSLNKGGQKIALITVDKLLYQVRVGNHLGLNYGRITKVDETEVVMREIVQDAAGEWVERSAALQLPREVKMNPQQRNTTAKQWLGWLIAGFFAWSVSALALAQNSIRTVTGSVLSGGEVVKIEMAQPLTAVPAGFVVQSPARIALDFPGVTSELGRSAIEMNQGNLRSVNVVQAGDRTRLVLNLKQATAYRTELQGNSLLILLDSAPGAALVAGMPAAFAENRNRDTLPLRDIDFRLGPDNTGRVIVDLANNQVGVDVKQQGRNLIVEFTKSTLSEGLRRRLDVADFNTPVQFVNTQQVGDRVRMTIDARGDWEHSAYQSDSRFVVEVRARKVDPTKLTAGTGYSGEKLSLNFQNIEVRSLLQVIADFTNFNIVTSDSVSGALTLRLKDVPWDQALDIIMQAKNLGVRRNGSVLWIAPKDEINAKEKLEFEARAAIETLEPLKTQSFQLNYTKALVIAQGLSGGGAGAGGGGGGAAGNQSRILSPRGSVIAESRTNQLFVSDIPSKLAQVAELIQKLDVPVRQVLIEARIVEASDSFGKSLGVRLGGGVINTQSTFGAMPTVTPNAVTGGVFGSQPSATTTFTNANFINLPAISAGGSGSAPGTFALSLFNSSFSRILNLEISALEADGKGRVVSSPRVITADQTKALIEQGEEIPYQQATSSGATSISFRKAVLKLEVTPQITPEGNIILTLDVSKDARGVNTSAGPAINTKHVQTEVLVENGGTVVIGGIFELTEANDESRIPFLGELPVLGALFRTRTKTANKTEMLVFITPKMISDRGSVR